GAADSADELDLRRGPAEPGAGQRERRRVRVDLEPVGADAPRERGADAVQHRVAAGEDCDAVAAGRELVEEGLQRRRGRAPPGLDLVRQQLELAGRAHDDVRPAQRLARALAEAGPAVGADADDLHAVSAAGSGIARPATTSSARSATADSRCVA